MCTWVAANIWSVTHPQSHFLGILGSIKCIVSHERYLSSPTLVCVQGVTLTFIYVSTPPINDITLFSLIKTLYFFSFKCI